MSEDRLADRHAIAELMTGWIYRDTMRWDELTQLFHEDATIKISWFSGTARDFIDGSRRMGASPLRTKPVIGSPMIRFAGERAFAETNTMIAVCVTETTRFVVSVTQTAIILRVPPSSRKIWLKRRSFEDLVDLGIGMTTRNRFLDRVSRRDGVWRIAHRDAVDDMGGSAQGNHREDHDRRRTPPGTGKGFEHADPSCHDTVDGL